MIRPLSLLVPLALLAAAPPAAAQVTVDDFESYEAGGLPTRWKYLKGGTLHDLTGEWMRPKERFTVIEDAGRGKVLQAYSEGESVHLTMVNGDGVLDWDATDLPVLSWDWKANRLPPGAREDRDPVNDSAGALYVVFSMDGFLVKRPKAIKYVYSSALPVGTVVSYGKLKVVVVSSGLTGEWETVRRNVLDDYRELFGGRPPRRPLSLRLWSDSDNTGSPAEVEFDDIRLSR